MSEHKDFQLAESQPIGRDGDGQPLVLQTKDFSWAAPILHGSCKLSGMLDGTLNKGPTVRLQSDGTGAILATFFSESSGDSWLIDDMHLMDSGGAVLTIVSNLSSPATTTDRQEITWVGQFTFPPDFFAAITLVNFKYRC